MDRITYVGNADVSAIEQLYAAYKSDTNNVDFIWQKFL